MTTGKAEVQSRSIITRRVASEDDDMEYLCGKLQNWIIEAVNEAHEKLIKPFKM